MWPFHKNKKKQTPQTQINQMDNEDLKEKLANFSLSMLQQGVDYDQLANTRCRFGYLYNFPGHGLEGLFQITTDKGTFYFAAQGDSLKRVNLDEESFKSTTDTVVKANQF